MQWFFTDDHTPPVFTAEQHVKSKHITGAIHSLPEKAVLFCLGRGLPLLQERFPTRLLAERLPGFITHSPAFAIEGREGLCFLDGGRGAPQAACTVETLHALGVKETLLVGLCGAFGEDIQVGDVLLPEKILVEEGSSLHYSAQPVYAQPDSLWAPDVLESQFSAQGLALKCRDTVTTDAVYRQTYHKEALWREKGCAGVDMEASATVNVCHYFGMRCTVLLMASDKHPLTPNAPAWAWGNGDFGRQQDGFLAACIQLALAWPKALR